MKYKKLVLMIFLALLFVSFSSPGKDNSNKSAHKLNKNTAGVSRQIMNANNVTSWIRANGLFNWDVAQSWNGEFPKLSGVGTIFSEGVVFGGFCNDGLYTNSLRVTGNTYFNGMQAGSILTANGNTTGAEDPSSSAVNRVWGVRPDVTPFTATNAYPDLTNDAATFFQISPGAVGASQIQTIINQYIADWNEWPASKGAPWYVDADQVVRNDNAFDHTNPHHIPGMPGATKSMWFVCNDLNPSVSEVFAGSPPMGIEQQMLLWSYASSTPLNNMIFRQVKLIYKGNRNSPTNAEIDSMYIVQWADGDVGDAGDDFAGCDSTLGLGYQYNANVTDSKYAAVGLAAPAVGYDILNGVAYKTGNFSDSAVVNFQWRHGYKYWSANPLSAYDYFAAGSPINDPDDGTYTGTQQWYNLMRGDLPRPGYPSGIPYYSSSTYASANGIVTKYCPNGDPTTGTGWVDGLDLSAGDRRMVNVHGPFTLKLGDTAEVVISLIQAMGSDNIGSVKLLRNNSSFALRAFKNLFKLPSPPPAPSVSISALDQEIILNWGGPQSASVESSFDRGYAFEGYNIYQFSSSSSKIEDATTVKIATYDIVDGVKVIVGPAIDPASGATITKVYENGNDTGLKRVIDLTKDYLKQRPLVDGQAYYFAVTAYSYDPYWNVDTSQYYSPGSPTLESDPLILVITPHIPNPGTRLTAQSGNALQVTHAVVDSTKPSSDGSVTVIVQQPDKLTGDNYNVQFDNTGTTWSVVDVTKNVTIATGTNQSGDANYPIVDGIQAIIVGPQPGMKEWTIPSGTRRFSPVGGWAGLGLEGFSTAANPTAYDETAGTIGMAGHFAFGGIGTTLTSAQQYHTVLLKLAAVDHTNLWDPKAVPTDANYSLAYRWLRAVGATSTPADPSFAPWIINKGSGYPYQDYNYGVPFSAWDMSTNPPTRLAVGMFENNVAGASLDGRYWPPLTTGDNTVNREFCYIFSAPYTTTPDPTFESNLSNNASLPLMWVMTCNRRADADWAAGDQFEIIAANVNGSNDIFKFKAPSVMYYADSAKLDVDKINVFPNPYFGTQSRETSRLNKFVTFNHLPASATIRIFSLSGVPVRTITKNDATQFTTWNLLNDHNLPVASGIYMVYVDMPTLGKSKILKLALIQEEQVLPNY
jgi:hypothetical protein